MLYNNFKVPVKLQQFFSQCKAYQFTHTFPDPLWSQIVAIGIRIDRIYALHLCGRVCAGGPKPI